MLLKKLTEASGVSGNEGEIRNIIIEEIKDYVDSYHIDKIGNIIAYKNKDKSDRKLMLAAHMDEVGLIVRGIDEYGLLQFTTVGGIDKRVLVSKPVYVGDKKLNGVIGAKPIHLQKKEERKLALSIEDLYIDIGATDKKDAERYVSIGDYVTFNTCYKEFGDKKAVSKAFDDRVGCAVLIDAIKELEDESFVAAFTVMEEIGLRGAGPAAYSVEPDFGLILEGTVCYDEEKLDSHLSPTSQGKGPALSLIDRTTIYDREMRDKIIDIAVKNKIPYQFRKSAMGGNDSGMINTSKSGCSTTTISVPSRNIHSTASVLDRRDYENTLNLVKEIIKAYNKEEI